jgi:hypothetical protein
VRSFAADAANGATATTTPTNRAGSHLIDAERCRTVNGAAASCSIDVVSGMRLLGFDGVARRPVVIIGWRATTGEEAKVHYGFLNSAFGPR